MSSEFFVNLQEAKDEARVRLGVRQEGNTCFITPLCSTEEELAAAVHKLQAELGRLLDEGQEELRARQKIQADADSSRDPASIWSTMKSMEGREDMFYYFNSLEEPVRREAAEYILTQVSMFKGLGPVFASHYNVQSAYLE